MLFSTAYTPVQLPFEDTCSGSGGEWKAFWTYRALGAEFVPHPNGVLSPPDLEVTTPIYYEGEVCNYHLVDHKRSGFVLDAAFGLLKPKELHSYNRLVVLSKEHPVALVEGFEKFTWLIDGVLLADQTMYFDKALVKYYGYDMARVRHIMYRALDAYALARRAANDNNQQTMKLVGAQ